MWSTVMTKFIVFSCVDSTGCSGCSVWLIYTSDVPFIPEWIIIAKVRSRKTAPPRCAFVFLLYPSFVSCTMTDSVYAAKLIYPSCIYIQYLISCLFLWQTFVCDTAAWTSHVPSGVNKVISINQYLCIWFHRGLRPSQCVLPRTC